MQLIRSGVTEVNAAVFLEKERRCVGGEIRISCNWGLKTRCLYNPTKFKEALEFSLHDSYRCFFPPIVF